MHSCTTATIRPPPASASRGSVAASHDHHPTGAEWIARHGQAWNDADAEGLAFITEMNRTVLPLAPAEQEAWIGKVTPLLQAFADKAVQAGLPGDAFLADLKAGVATARAAKTGK